MKENIIWLVFVNVSEYKFTVDGVRIGRPIKCYKSIEEAVAYLRSIATLSVEDVFDEEDDDERSYYYNEEGHELWIESRTLE